VDQAFNKEATDKLDCIIARMFYIGGLSFNLTRNPWYVKAFNLLQTIQSSATNLSATTL